MSHEELKNRQTEILNKTLEILKNSEKVLGIILTGSYARGEEDGFSDIDMACFLSNEERTGREELFDQIEKIFPVLSKLYVYDKNALVLFENGVRLDLDFNKPSEISKEDKNKAKILFDPQGILEKDLGSAFASQDTLSIVWNDNEGSLVDWFFWMFRQAYCWAKRGQQEDKRSFDKLNNSICTLSSIRSKLIEMRLWTVGKKGYLKEVDPEFATRLVATYPIFDAYEILKANRFLLEEYKRVLPEYCQKVNISYSTEKVKKMEQLLAEFDQLS